LEVAMLFAGRVQSGKGDASRWLALFNTAYSRKTGIPVFPGSLNVALDAPFDWFAPAIEERTIWFGREEYGGERDILLVPCVLANLNAERAMLWTPTTAARNRPDPLVVEVIAGVNLRATYALSDGDVVEIRLLEASTQSPHVNAVR
jgi:CTP-dependent riboflavin kinase